MPVSRLAKWKTTFQLVSLGALILGKVILLGDILKLGDSLRNRALVWVVLGKTLIFTVLLMAFHVAEELIRAAIKGLPLMESILNAEIDGKKLNDGEILGMFYTFYVGGLDTVYATISWSMRHIATHPLFQQFLRDNPDTAREIELALRQNAGLIAEKFLENGSREDFDDDDAAAGGM